MERWTVGRRNGLGDGLALCNGSACACASSLFPQDLFGITNRGDRGLTAVASKAERQLGSITDGRVPIRDGKKKIGSSKGWSTFDEWWAPDVSARNRMASDSQ